MLTLLITYCAVAYLIGTFFVLVAACAHINLGWKDFGYWLLSPVLVPFFVVWYLWSRIMN